MTQLLDLRERIQAEETKQEQKGTLPLLVMVAVGLSGASVLLTLVNLLYTRQITRKAFPTLVQMESGRTVEIGFESPNYRSPTVVKAFVSDTLYHLMTMTSYGVGSSEVSALNPNRRKATPIKVKTSNGTGAITQTAWLASEALESKFGDTFRAKLAQMTPPDVFTGREEIILKFDYVKEPVEVNDAQGNWAGTWTVDVVANLKVYRLQQGEVKSIPFNKRVTVRPITPQPIHDVEQFGELAVALNASQLSGLQITDIKDLPIAE
ncbi:MAG: hypothetical protein AAF703_22205 [Cyanobacteria bacterium P01_D01_bin.105]